MRSSRFLAVATFVWSATVSCANPQTVPTSVPTPNTAPTISVSIVDRAGCSPLPTKPCVIPVAATVQDAEGGPMTFRWSGCAQGSEALSQCVVSALGDVAGAVEVTDAAGASARAEFTAVGRNSPPRFDIVHTHAWPNGGSIEFMAKVTDPDVGALWGSQYCVSAATTGSCEKPTLKCPSAGPELYVLRTGAPGLCEVTVQTKDDWGTIGTSILRFDIDTPQTMLMIHK
jgi:hypothetical protein